MGQPLPDYWTCFSTDYAAAAATKASRAVLRSRVTNIPRRATRRAGR